MKRCMSASAYAAILAWLAIFDAAAAAKEHAVIRPYPGAVCIPADAEYKDYSEYEFPCYDKATDERVTKTVKGQYWQLYYEIRDSAGSRNEGVSSAEILANYKAAAAEKGGKVEYEDGGNGFLTFTLPRQDGGQTWCYIEASDGYYGLWIVDEKAFEKKLSFSAAEMKQAIDNNGHVPIYGILFDTDKADLKLESVVCLQEIVKLMQQNAGLKLEVQGHTDGQGDDGHNLKLSEDRAHTVVQYLLLFGIVPDRLMAKGYGETKPVAANDNEDGRSRNRRVELVKR